MQADITQTSRIQKGRIFWEQLQEEEYQRQKKVWERQENDNLNEDM